KICLHIAPVEAVGLLHYPHSAGCGSVKRLPIRMLAILQVLECLGIYSLVGDNPENKACVAVEVTAHDTRHGTDGQPGLAAAGWHLEHNIGHRAPAAVRARREGVRSTRRGELARCF